MECRADKQHTIREDADPLLVLVRFVAAGCHDGLGCCAEDNRLELREVKYPEPIRKDKCRTCWCPRVDSFVS